MATENTLSQQLLDLLATRDLHPEMLDRSGRPTDAPEAKTFTFDYQGASGKNYGTMVIVLDSDNEMKIMYGDNLGRTMEGTDKNEFFDFIQHLSKKATMNRWTHTIADISQLKHTMQGLAAIQEGLFEGYYGNRNISYAGEPTQARLKIKHSQPLGENDARFRHVESLFVETADGECFRLGFRNLSGGRAMLEHVRQGGKPYDIRGCHLTEMVSEIATLSRFNRASAGRVLEGVTQEVVSQAQVYYKQLRENLKRMSTSRGYSKYFESWHPADITEQEELVENIKTLFVEQTIDTRIEQALPLLAKIQQGRDMKEAEIFESWINNLAEGTWNLPETPEQLDKLKTLMASELIVGPDAINATEQLYDLVGDDILFDRLSELAAQDPRANAFNDTEVMNRLAELGIQMPEPTEPGNPADPQTAPEPQAMAEDGPAWARVNSIGSKLPKSDTETFGIQKGRGYEIQKPKDWTPGDTRLRAIQQLIPDQDKKDHIRSRLGKHAAPVLPEQGVAEASDQSTAISQEQLNQMYANAKPMMFIKNTPVALVPLAKINQIGTPQQVQQVQQALGSVDQTSYTDEYKNKGYVVFQWNGTALDLYVASPEVVSQKYVKFSGQLPQDEKSRGKIPSLVALSKLGIDPSKVPFFVKKVPTQMVSAKQLGLEDKTIQTSWGEQTVSPGGFMVREENGHIYTVAPDAQGLPIGYLPAQQGVAESTELNTMLKYAGVPVAESRMIDESGETLMHVLDRFKHEVAQFEQGADLDNDLFDALYDYYVNKGEMPYGTAKARSGDPYEWVSDRLDQELGTGNHTMRAVPEADAISTFEVMSGFDAPVAEGACNMTSEGAYCPEHGLAKCEGSMYESREGDAVLARIKSLALIR